MAKYAGVSLALDKKRQHFEDSAFPLLFQGEFIGEGMHRREVGKLSVSDAAEQNAEEKDGNA